MRPAGINIDFGPQQTLNTSNRWLNLMRQKDADRVANSLDPDQTALSRLSDLGLHIFPRPVWSFQYILTRPKMQFAKKNWKKVKIKMYYTVKTVNIETSKNFAVMNLKFYHTGQVMQKCVLCHMRTTKVQISLRIHAVWSAPLLFAA